MSKKSIPKKICIICEGEEEYDYIKHLCECRVWNPAYTIKPKNAKGHNRIMPIYQNTFQNDSYDLILIFCDTEEQPYTQYKSLINNLNRLHDKKNIANSLIIFANPCTLQIILSHFGKVRLTSSSKTKNAPIVKQLTGVDEYRAIETQRRTIMKQIDANNYQTMKDNIGTSSIDYQIISSTNFKTLLDNLENPNTTWVSALAKKTIGND
ncbi:MAG: hypothetical protein OSJ74_03700 [Clostridia bacterium]|nr:hypothetical protein [Clostridia bacterium]